MRWACKSAEILLVIAIGANLVALAYYFWMRPRVGLYQAGEHFPLPVGYLPDGQLAAPAASGCYLLRVTAAGCEYCRQDQPEYRKMAEAARQAGCEVFEVAPKPMWESTATPGVVQLEYIDMPLGRTLVPYLTPQTLLVASDAKLTWFRVGAMDAGSLADGLAAVGKMGAAR